MTKKNPVDYWFLIEPYVCINTTSEMALLYNTLDGVSIESYKYEVIELINEILEEKNGGIVLLEEKRYKQKNVKFFINELRDKFMGDIIEVSLSKCKPVQLLPFFNFKNKYVIYKKLNFSFQQNVLENLSEITIKLDAFTDIKNLISFLYRVPEKVVFNIELRSMNIAACNELLVFLNNKYCIKNLIFSYKNIVSICSKFNNNFSCIVEVDFPLDKPRWLQSLKMLINQNLPFKYIFNVKSIEEFEFSEQLIEQHNIKIYSFNLIYTVCNVDFFQKYVFFIYERLLCKEVF